MDTWLETAAKGGVYAAALLALGTAMSQQLLARAVGASRVSVSRTATHAAQRLDSLLVLAAATLLCTLTLRAVGHTVASFGWSEGFLWENLHLIAIESNWGLGWQVQAAAGAVFTVTAIVARLHPLGLTRTLGFLGAAAVCISLPRTGHAASSASGWVLHSVHVLAAGLWAGTLLAVWSLGRNDERPLQAAMLRLFAPVAMTAVAVLSASGAIATVTYIGSTSNLVDTDYGRILMAKIALVGVMLVLGARNYQTLRASTTADVPRTVGVEAVVAVGVIVLTTWLTETAHP